MPCVEVTLCGSKLYNIGEEDNNDSSIYLELLLLNLS